MLLFYFYFRGIGDHGLIDPIEGVNASVETHMLATGNYFVPKVGDELTAGKSLLTWWLASLALKIFGWGEFGVRFWSAMAGVGMVIAAASSARHSINESIRKSWLAATICASTVICFTSSQIASSHALYGCLTGFALMYTLKGMDNKNYFMLAHLFIVLAFMAHGAGGFVFPFMAVIIFGVFNGENDFLINFFTWPPAALISIFGICLYILALMFGNGWILHFMRCENLGLDLNGIFGYILFAFASFMPWHGFFFNALNEVYSQEFSATRKNNPRILILIWVFIFALAGVVSGDILSLSACAPALAALTGDKIDEWFYQKNLTDIKISVALNLVITLPSIALLLPIAINKFSVMGAASMSLIPCGLFAVLFIFASWYYTKTQQIAKWVRNVPISALLCLMPLAGVFDLASEKLSIRDAGLRLRSEIQGNNIIVQYAVNHPSVYFYTLRNSSLFLSSFTPGLQDSKYIINSFNDLNRLWIASERVFIIMDIENKLPAKLSGTIYPLLDEGGVSLLSNK